jgi:hypothetical protein
VCLDLLYAVVQQVASFTPDSGQYSAVTFPVANRPYSENAKLYGPENTFSLTIAKRLSVTSAALIVFARGYENVTPLACHSRERECMIVTLIRDDYRNTGMLIENLL